MKGTMKIHQVISVSPGQIKYRDITCLCKTDSGMLDCPCFQLKEATLGDPAASNQLPASHDKADTTWRPGTIELNHVGEWCVVNYDHEGYPVEEHNIKVKCMRRNGINTFFWPSPKEDNCWYSDGQIISLMPEPHAVNKRSVQMRKSTWKYVEEHLG
jgi:hypothetical protein